MLTSVKCRHVKTLCLDVPLATPLDICKDLTKVISVVRFPFAFFFVNDEQTSNMVIRHDCPGYGIEPTTSQKA